LFNIISTGLPSTIIHLLILTLFLIHRDLLKAFTGANQSPMRMPKKLYKLNVWRPTGTNKFYYDAWRFRNKACVKALSEYRISLEELNHETRNNLLFRIRDKLTRVDLESVERRLKKHADDELAYWRQKYPNEQPPSRFEVETDNRLDVAVAQQDSEEKKDTGNRRDASMPSTSTAASSVVPKKEVEVVDLSDDSLTDFEEEPVKKKPKPTVPMVSPPTPGPKVGRFTVKQVPTKYADNQQQAKSSKKEKKIKL